MNLDTRNRLMHLVKLYQGDSVNTSQVRLAEVFRAAIGDNAPSSSCTQPSIWWCLSQPDDVAVTHAIVNGGKLLDIDVWIT